MNYALLREKGVARLQQLASSLWTDYNIHDPGVTILEALAYAITDLGYRSSYKIQDLLALAPGDTTDIKNFFTAYEILTNRALTPDDYRKLLMDVEVTDPSTGVKAGVKNAWLLKADRSEIPFYVHPSENLLSYSPDPSIPNQDFIHLRGLYNVMLELDENSRFGDMNESFMEGVMTIADQGSMDPKLFGKKILIEIDLPRWDNSAVDWSDQSSIRSKINKKVTLDFSEFPSNYIFFYTVAVADGQISFSLTCGIDTDGDGIANINFSPAALAELESQVNAFLYDVTTGLVAEYQRKIHLTLQLIAEVRKTLMANRNLCEDFLALNAVKVEEIALCGDIDVENGADIEEVLANIYHEIGKFLSYTVYFHTLDEMMAKGKTPDEIFLGPRLKHGFIDDEELAKAKARDTIHVSDLYQIIMDVPGVQSVKNLQIANIPEDAGDNIPTKSVKWCLELAVDKFYVPRLSVDRSNITFYKDVLPFEPQKVEVLERLAALKATDRLQRLENPVLDLPVPQGEYKELDTYVSVQEEFPLVYGIGEVGLPDSASDLRKAQAHQLKGYLLFFDQLLANYLTQLSHVKELFSMNEARDVNGNFVIGRTYYTQTLLEIIPHATDLYYAPTAAQDQANLDLLAEDKTLFEDRRNRFLDHLLARFAESFADYALLTYRIDGPKAPDELIEDKLRFLNSYPELSYGRAGAMDYTDTAAIWNVDNVSGLEKRVSLLTGIDPYDPLDLVFSAIIQVNDLGSTYSFTINRMSTYNALMNSVDTYATQAEAIIAAERAINAGLFIENYFYFDTNGDHDTPVDPQNPPLLTTFFYKLYSDGVPVAVSVLNTFGSISAAETAITTDTMPSLREEFETISASNRKNLDCALETWVDIQVTYPAPVPPCRQVAEITYTIHDQQSNPILVYTAELMIRDNESNTEFTERVEAEKHDVFLLFAQEAAIRDNYRLETDPISNDYFFSVLDHCGDSIASSSEVNFNQSLATWLNGKTVEVFDQDGTDLGSFAGITTTSNEALISITLGAPVTLTGGKIVGQFSDTIASADESRKQIVIASDLRSRVKTGDTVTLTFDGDANPYTVTRIRLVDYGLTKKTELTLLENIPATFVTAAIDGSFSLPIEIVDSATSFRVAGGVDQAAIDEFIDFMQTTFLGHEGFHLIEHILLRPVVKGKKRFDPATNTTLSDSLSVQGNIYYVKTLPIANVTPGSGVFEVAGDISSELVLNQQISVRNSPLNDRLYTVLGTFYNGTNTEITVYETISDATIAGDIAYTRTFPIDSIDPPILAQPSVINIAANLGTELQPGNVMIISGSELGRNDARYTILSVVAGASSAITIDKVEVEYNDKFLSVNQLPGCADCRYEDPYSFVVTIVMPAWRGRFANMAFREFFERTLRLEAPAHVVLNICWVSCDHMGRFESAYRNWLVEHARSERNVFDYAITQNTLIDVLLQLRTVFPKGTLHNCEQDNNLRNSIILNKTALGTI